MTTHTLDVPGARLTYDVTGAGPVLLLLPGGAADSTMFAAIAPILAEHHTVVTPDPRGISRSAPGGQDSIRTHADDVHRLLTAVGHGPADVFASSGGAITMLEHVVRHPADVRTVVLHEPPVTRYLPAPDGPDLPAIYREHGLHAALTAFSEMSGFDITPPAEPTPAELAQMKVMEGNFAYFFGHLMTAIGDYQPDLDALAATPARLIVGVGEKSAGLPAHVSGLGLAGALGIPAETFPGDHGGFLAEPVAFAARLREILEAR